MKSRWPFLAVLIVCVGVSLSTTVVNDEGAADGSVVPDGSTPPPPAVEIVTPPAIEVNSEAAANVDDAPPMESASLPSKDDPLPQDGVASPPEQQQQSDDVPVQLDAHKLVAEDAIGSSSTSAPTRGDGQDGSSVKPEASETESTPPPEQPTPAAVLEKEVTEQVPSSSEPTLAPGAVAAEPADVSVPPVDANAAPSDANSPVISPSGDIDTFSDWTKKKLEAVAKERESSAAAGAASTSSRGPPSPGTQDGKPSSTTGSGRVKVKKRNRKNYASSDCGAKVLASNPEAQSASAIISSGLDEYFLSPCKVKNFIYFVIELCEAIEPSMFELGVFELYSSLPKDIVVGINDRYPTREWTQLGKFEAKDVRGTQNFTVEQSPRVFGKYVKVEILSHFGSEHFCPVSMFKIYGTSELEAMEHINVDSHVALENGHGGPLYALDEDEYIDDGDDESEQDVPKAKNLFGSAKDAVMSIVKKAAEAFSAGAPKDGSQLVASQNRTLDVDDGKEGPLAGWTGACACPSKRIPLGVSGEAWDAYSCARQWDSQHLADVRPKNWQPCFDSLRHDVADLQAKAGYGCDCSSISRLFAAFLTKDQILALAVMEAFEAAELNRSFAGNVTCDEVVVGVNVTLDNKTAGGPSEVVFVGDQERKTEESSTEKPTVEQDVIRPSPSSNTIDPASTIAVDLPSVPGPSANVAPSSAIDTHDLATDLVGSEDGGRPSQPSVSPTSTSLPTMASFLDPGEGLPSSSQPTDAGFVIVEPPPYATSKATTPVVAVEEQKAAVVAPVPPPVPAPSTLTSDTAGQETGAIMGDGSGDSMGKIEIGANVPYVQLPASSQPPGNKETVFWRLSNKVKALELNLTLSSLYLEELSRSYKRQVEDLTKSVNKYQQQMNNYTSAIQGLVSKVESLNGSLDETRKKLEVYESAQPVPFWLFIASQSFLIFAITVLWFNRPQQPVRPVPVARTDPTVAPAIMRPARSRQSVLEASSKNTNYAWLDQRRVVCGKAVPMNTLVTGYQNGGVGSSPTRTLQVVPTGVVGKSRGSSGSDHESGTTRLRLISGNEGMDLSPRRMSNAVQSPLANGGVNSSRPSSLALSTAPSSSTTLAVTRLQESTNVRPSSRSPARSSLDVKKTPSSSHISSSNSPSKLVRRHSFTTKEDAGQKWSLAGGKSRLKTSFVLPNQPVAASKKRKKKNKSSVDLQASNSSGSVRSGVGDSRDSLFEAGFGGVESTNRWFVLDTQDVRM